ncbi:MAG: hypothetical protein QM817_40120 [Archangium sp.]
MQDVEFIVTLAGGGGVYVEAGGIFGDLVSLTYRGELTTTVFTVYGSNGAFVDVALGEHVAVGIGAAFTVFNGFLYRFTNEYELSFAGFSFPVRAHVMLGSPRDASIARRQGWTLSFHFAPAVSTTRTYSGEGLDGAFTTRTRAGFTAGIGIGYLWW